MIKLKKLRDGAVSVGILLSSFGIALVIDGLFHAEELIPLFFVLGIFWVALLTDGYFWGVAMSLCSVLAVNFAFTYPYFRLNFEITENALSAGVFLAVSLSACTMTQKLRKHEKLQLDLEREKMRGNLLRAVSHDLRTPLTSIYGASSTMEDFYDSLSKEDKLQMLRGIREDSQWLIQMVENLLSVTRIENEQVELKKSSVVAEELITSALDRFNHRYPQVQVELEVPDSFIQISADPVLIEQVLVNLLENAVQHAEGMTKLLLRVYAREKQIHFEVEDNGCGIEKEKLTRIFSGGVHKEESVDGRRRGMGIGLSVCAAIIKAHGGTVYANKLRSGMCFGFTLEGEEITDESEPL